MIKRIFNIFRKKKKKPLNYENYSLSGLYDFINNPDLYERKLLIERQRFDVSKLSEPGYWNVTGNSVGIIRGGGWYINE